MRKILLLSTLVLLVLGGIPRSDIGKLVDAQDSQNAPEDDTLRGTITVTEECHSHNYRNPLFPERVINEEYTERAFFRVNLPRNQDYDYPFWDGAVSYEARGSGTHSEDDDSHSFKSNWSGSGSGETDLELAIDEDGLTYRFRLWTAKFDIKEHQETHYKPGHCPEGGEGPCTHSHDDIDKRDFNVFTIEEKIDRKSRVISGSKTRKSDAYTDTITWNLRRGIVDTEAVIETPEGYENWQPMADKTEDRAGPMPLAVKVRVHKKGDPKKPAPNRAKFRFELVDTTKEKGVCLNWPPEDKAQETYDLRIEQEKNEDLQVKDGKEGQRAETKEKNLTEAQVIISCFDWGAFGILKVTAVLDDGTEVPAYLESDKSRYELKIPKDDDDNYIADCWEKNSDVYGSYAEDDKDSIPEGDGDLGDGLTLYEEYRGFMENGKHICGDPKKKDLFVCNKIGEKVEPGFALLENITGLVVHSKLKPEGKNAPGELDANRMINRNHTKMAHIVDQHGVFIVEGEEGFRSTVQSVKGSEDIIGTPKRCEQIKIGLGLLNQQFPIYQLASVVAHELLHCCSVWHHGQTDEGTRRLQTKADAAGVQRILVFDLDARGNTIGPGTPIRLYFEADGSPVDPNEPLLSTGYDVWMGCKQGQHSGNTDCVVRYSCARCYKTRDGAYKYFYDQENIGLELCTDAKGTGVNELGRRPEPRYGDATGGKGNCKKQICVNDKYH